jgi:hypothetical protein
MAYEEARRLSLRDLVETSIPWVQGIIDDSPPQIDLQPNKN